MKKLFYLFAIFAITLSCKTTQQTTQTVNNQIVATIDLVNIQDDRVFVTVDPNIIKQDKTTFFIPKTVPGTYSIDNYGKFIMDFKALNYDGEEMVVIQVDENSWTIENAEKLDKVTYWVNDSFDVQGEGGVFSPAGTNIAEDDNFMLNLHGFVGYFETLQEQPYQLEITRPSHLVGGTALLANSSKPLESNNEASLDVFNVDRYFEVIDHPIMYASPDTTGIDVQGMKVLLHVYSPNNVYTTESIKPEIEKMINAQKNFLGEIDNTSIYAILLYLADTDKEDARGFGALEHHTSTVVVLPETMPLESLNKTMTDVVSHEFFHILTPLNVHSEEIHYFNFNNPEMSQHLWMYEGVTEYFAHLFQINQGLIDEEEFYNRISEKIKTSLNFDDTMSFTKMSKNILEDEYKDSYYNVYLKGALIGMALDIELRSLSNGETGILDLMKKLSSKYGKDQPFIDDELIPVIVDLTYPEIQLFFDAYVSGTTPIPYNTYFEKVGLQEEKIEVETSYFINGQVPYIDGNPDTNEIFFRKEIGLNSFFENLGVQGGDVIKNINETAYSIENVYELITKSQSWEEGDEFEMVIVRDGEEITLNGTISTPKDSNTIITEMDLPANDKRVVLRKSWLKS